MYQSAAGGHLVATLHPVELLHPDLGSFRLEVGFSSTEIQPQRDAWLTYRRLFLCRGQKGTCFYVFYIRMSRDPRYIPPGGCLVEITHRTLQGRHLLTPSPRLNESFVGVLARAQQYSPVRIAAVTVMSSHFHLLLDIDHAGEMERFMWFLGCNLSKETGRLHDWPGSMWQGRYHHIPISDEPEMQIDRLRYTLAGGVKEGLVRRARNWKGVHSVDALIHGEPLVGHWFNRSLEYAARNRGERYHRLQYSTAESVVLAPIPCWRHLPETEWRRNVAELVEEVEAQAGTERRSQRRSKKGRRKSEDDDHDDRVQLRHPHYRPPKLDRSPKPRFHAKSKRARRALEEAYAWFLKEYRAAAHRLSDGADAITAGFPEGAFPPRLPFVGEPRGQPP